ncbi:MAG: hypothetical protein IJS14_02960 [Lentisphaeria bacterium]|nr:hypothetical protein [Lentisphaeria bacterium]
MILKLFHRLFDLYGEQHWWPCKSGSRWEIAAGAVLVQNTAWGNVEKALANLEAAGLMSPKRIVSFPEEDLREIIRPAGFYRQKAAYLKAAAEFFLLREEEYLRSDRIPELRKDLLSVNGIGRETADDILLYAFKKPVFIIDAYTRRIAERHLGLDGKLPYDDLQRIFMEALPSDADLYGEYHALILALGKDSCRKSGCGPVCSRLA